MTKDNLDRFKLYLKNTTAMTLERYPALTTYVIANVILHLGKCKQKDHISSLKDYQKSNRHYKTLKPLESQLADELFVAIWKKEKNDAC